MPAHCNAVSEFGKQIRDVEQLLTSPSPVNEEALHDLADDGLSRTKPLVGRKRMKIAKRSVHLTTPCPRRARVNSIHYIPT